MQAFVVIATKGRAGEVRALADYLARQTCPIARIVLVGADPTDLPDLSAHALNRSGRLVTALAERPGLCAQRNLGLSVLRRCNVLPAAPGGAFVAFFDDDFRMADDWLAQAAEVFRHNANVWGLTGRVLADGVNGPGLQEAEAADFLGGRRPPQRHGYGGTVQHDVDSAYGCNMAFRAEVFGRLQFDEKLPLYGWQEDRDFSARVARFGRVVLEPGCRGVHLGAKGGRSPGRKLGYAQIANPAYLVRKGTMRWGDAVRLAGRNLLANHLKALRPEPWVDRRGRARGNWQAISDLLRGRASPMRILDL